MRGPVETYLGLRERFYGSVAIDPAAAAMTVDLKAQDGTVRHRTVIPSAAR